MRGRKAEAQKAFSARTKGHAGGQPDIGDIDQTPGQDHTIRLSGDVEDYVADEHALGRLLDIGVIVPRLTELYRWSAVELGIADVAGLVHDATPA